MGSNTFKVIFESSKYPYFASWNGFSIVLIGSLCTYMCWLIGSNCWLTKKLEVGKEQKYINFPMKFFYKNVIQFPVQFWSNFCNDSMEPFQFMAYCMFSLMERYYFLDYLSTNLLSKKQCNQAFVRPCVARPAKSKLREFLPWLELSHILNLTQESYFEMMWKEIKHLLMKCLWMNIWNIVHAI